MGTGRGLVRLLVFHSVLVLSDRDSTKAAEEGKALPDPLTRSKSLSSIGGCWFSLVGLRVLLVSLVVLPSLAFEGSLLVLTTVANLDPNTSSRERERIEAEVGNGFLRPYPLPGSDVCSCRVRSSLRHINDDDPKDE